jgi:hypothetical protein
MLLNSLYETKKNFIYCLFIVFKFFLSKCFFLLSRTQKTGKIFYGNSDWPVNFTFKRVQPYEFRLVSLRGVHLYLLLINFFFYENNNYENKENYN